MHKISPVILSYACLWVGFGGGYAYCHGEPGGFGMIAAAGTIVHIIYAIITLTND